VVHDPGQGDDIADDDLTRINGIGAKTAERLRARGIRSYAALAACASDEIIAMLPDVTGVSAARVDGWLDQARTLQARSARPSQAVPDGPENGQHYESFLVRILLNEDGSVRRTTAQHIRTGQERHWPRLDRAGLPEFILTAIAAPPSPSAPSPSGPSPSAPSSSAPSPSGQPAVQPPAPPAAAQRSLLASSAVLSMERTALRAAQPFTMTMNVDFAEPPVGQVAYSAVVVARPLTGGPKRTLAHADGLLAPSSPSVAITAAGLPSGIYRLDGAVSLREPGADRPAQVAAMAEGLLVQVIPA
jgi:hypothetical protein